MKKFLIQIPLLSVSIISICLFSSYSTANVETNISLLVENKIKKNIQNNINNVNKTEVFPEVLGPTHEIAEEDLLKAFFNRINKMKASGEFDKRFNESKERIQAELNNPKGNTNLTKTENFRVWLLEPSIPETLPQKLLREAQNIEPPKLNRELLFINAEDEEQIKLARKINNIFPQSRIVLVSGSIAETSRILDKRIFFDQGSALVNLFGINSVPALVFNSEKGPAAAEFNELSLSELLKHTDKPDS